MFKVKEHEINPQNYLVMEKQDFMLFVSNHNLATFIDDGMIFTHYQGIQIVEKYEVSK